MTEAINKQNQAVINELIAPDYVHRTLQLRGREVFKKFRTKLWEGFPDWHVTIKDMIAEGEKVWVARAQAVNEIRRILKTSGQEYLSLGHPPPLGFVGRAEWETILDGFRVKRLGGFLQKWAVEAIKQQ